MATQIFGEILYYPQQSEYLSLTEFPSPESLKNRVIISTKPPKERFKSNRIKDSGNYPALDGSSESSEDESSGKESPDSTIEVEIKSTVRNASNTFFFDAILNTLFMLNANSTVNNLFMLVL
jgi:phosphatidylinositol phospholipase C delta